jgi:hypothetical protein
VRRENDQGKIMQRRLAAIPASDVVGYGRLMGSDEIGTLTALKARRREMVDAAAIDRFASPPNRAMPRRSI